MKKILALLLAQLIFLSLFAQNKNVTSPQQPSEGLVKWYTLDEALKLNKEKPKKILIDVYTDWCGWCKKMDKDVYTHPVIAKYLNDNFYTVKFNAETTDTVIFGDRKFINENKGPRSTHQFAMALLQGQMSYPSVVYLTEKLEYIFAIPGYKTPDQLEVILNYVAQNKFKPISIEEYQKTFVGQIKPSTIGQ
jgi:thioredoxin-related protein